MTPEEISVIRAVLPEHEPYTYFPDRESPWLLAQRMPEAAPVRLLRGSVLAPLMNRPALRPLIANCGGVLHRPEVLALARCDWTHSGVAEVAYGPDTRYFQRTLATWGTHDGSSWWNQISRPGGNLVVQVNFPAEHEIIFHRYLRPSRRSDLEFDLHPVRTTGLPTMAWVRMDVDLNSGVALIEEVQSDWFRNLRDALDDLRDETARGRELRNMERYHAQVLARYERDWPRAALLCALMLLRDEFAVDDVWMHQPEPGAALKRITGRRPPVSLYTRLPRHFGFEPTRDAPPFLERPARAALRKLRSRPGPLFWRLRFSRLDAAGC